MSSSRTCANAGPRWIRCCSTTRSRRTGGPSPIRAPQWSHCAVAPLYVAYMGLAGIQPLEPGFRRVEVRPQPADLEELELTAFTVRGPIHFRSAGKPGERELTSSCRRVVRESWFCPPRKPWDFRFSPDQTAAVPRRYALLPGEEVTLKLLHT